MLTSWSGSQVRDRLTLHKGDILDSHGLTKLLGEIRPQEIYHLAAQSHVSQSFETPEYTMQVNTMGTLNILQAIVLCGLEKHTRLYNVRASGLIYRVIRACLDCPPSSRLILVNVSSS